MSSQEPTRLLREVLSNEATERLRQESLGKVLQAARWRRVGKRGVVCVVSCLVLAAAWVLVPLRQSPDQVAPAIPKRMAAVSKTESPPKIEHISDAELLALFPGQTVALIGPPGRQRFLVLTPPPREAQSHTVY